MGIAKTAGVYQRRLSPAHFPQRPPGLQVPQSPPPRPINLAGVAPLQLPSTCHLPQCAAQQIAALLPDLSEPLSALGVPLEVTQLSHATVTRSMHENFCRLFAVGATARAVERIDWELTASGEQAVRLYEWWQCVRTAKDKASWGRKLYTLEAPLAAAVSMCSDWERVFHIIACSLTEDWCDVLPLDALEPSVQRLSALVQSHIEDPTTSTAEAPLWAFVQSQAM